MNESLRTHDLFVVLCCTYEWVLSHISIRRVKHTVCFSAPNLQHTNARAQKRGVLWCGIIARTPNMCGPACVYMRRHRNILSNEMVRHCDKRVRWDRTRSYWLIYKIPRYFARHFIYSRHAQLYDVVPSDFIALARNIWAGTLHTRVLRMYP